MIQQKKIDELSNEVLEKINQYYSYLNLDLNDVELDDLVENDLIFVINMGNKDCVPVQLEVYTNNKYILRTKYNSCKSEDNTSEVCNSMLTYTAEIVGTYRYDVLEIIKHSVDANNMTFYMNNLPKYEIISGNGHQFITDEDNKYLMKFLDSIDVDIDVCAICE